MAGCAAPARIVSTTLWSPICIFAGATFSVSSSAGGRACSAWKASDAMRRVVGQFDGKIMARVLSSAPREAGMKKHVELVGVLYIIWGALSMLVGLAMLALGLGAAAIITSAGPGELGAKLAASITAATFGTLAGIVLLWGVVHLWDGIALGRCREWARAAGLVLGVLNLFLLPFGTALGAYALWVLTNDQTRPLFEPRKA
jgi:hypothetical protein